jgi:hypothetical protein
MYIFKQGTRQNKMEKADILEMTVRHLRQLQRQQFSGKYSLHIVAMQKYFGPKFLINLFLSFLSFECFRSCNYQQVPTWL